MVFSSIPVYLDPSNWQQQPSHQNGDQSNAIPQLRQHHLPQPLAQPSPPPHPPPPRARPPPLQQHQPHHHQVIINGDIVGAAVPTSSINSPRSMSERARIANIPIPEACLNCPRCESTNTKFCYFNNYNLTQPRHFCKTCRRYWTRGGALRSVPVGGGCRRNKRSKSTSSNNNNNSKSISTSSSSPTGNTIPSFRSSTTTTNTVLDLARHLPQQLTLLSPLSQLTDHHVSSFNYNSFPLGDTNLELNNYQMGCNLEQQWRLNQQLQLLGAGLNSSMMGNNGLYTQFQGPNSNNQPSSFVCDTTTSHSHDDKPSSNSVFTHEKMEENNQGLTRNLMGNPTTNDNNSWAGATWSDYITTRFSSSNSCTKNPAE